eukprot:1055323-Pelagomonas_calceolata.AAC.2
MPGWTGLLLCALKFKKSAKAEAIQGKRKAAGNSKHVAQPASRQVSLQAGPIDELRQSHGGSV